jgi:hypothetical protein
MFAQSIVFAWQAWTACSLSRVRFIHRNNLTRTVADTKRNKVEGASGELTKRFASPAGKPRDRRASLPHDNGQRPSISPQAVLRRDPSTRLRLENINYGIILSKFSEF